MRWLLRRVAVIWAITLVTCAVAFLLARLKREPNPLEILDFDVCGDAICFRGIKVGMDWAEARQRLPDATEGNNADLYLELPISRDEVATVAIQHYGATVSIISALGQRHLELGGYFLPISAWEIVASHGSPCFVTTRDNRNGSSWLEMTYPKFRVQVLVRESQRPNGARDYRLQSDLRITQVILNSPKTLGICNAPAHYQSGYSQSAWYGFTSVDIYQARARRQVEVRER